ncbi:purine-cytosine permease family protein [Streptomyces qaidamensis]|uniref:purine-cytosine permease family protein n=1 Tax=Streptomyces qaidamensis TaxID=1783515 RepID=UPI003649BC02
MPEPEEATAAASRADAELPDEHLQLSHDDDPRVVAEQAVEEYTNHVVPPSARLGRWQVFGGWYSIASAMAFLYYGALSAALVGTTQALIGLGAVVVVYSLLGSRSARQALRSGLNSTLLSRELFGARGAALGSLLIAAAATYYAVFESSVLAAAFQSYFGVWDIRVWYTLVVLGMLPLMLGGLQTWWSKLNSISLPVYFFGVVLAVVVAGARFGWDGAWSHFQPGANPHGIPGWLTVFVLYMGVWILIPDTQDAARMGRSEDAAFHAKVTFGWVFYLVSYAFNGLAGILIVALAGPAGAAASEGGVVQAVIRSLGLVGFLVIVVSQIRINSANFYFASINLDRFVAQFSKRRPNRRAWVFVIAAIVLALMFTNVFGYIAKALAWQGVLVVSWVAMVIVSWLFDRGAEVEYRPRRVKALAPGFAVWMVSSGVGIALLQMPDTLPVWSALAPLVSFALAGAGYAVLRAAGISGRRATTTPDVRSELPSPWDVRLRCAGCGLSYVGVEMDRDESGRVRCLECQSMTV